MTPDPQTLIAFEKTITDMHAKGALSSDGLYQCYVTLASEYLCQHHDSERALAILNKCPEAYLSSTIEEQMKKDALFAKSVVELSYRLVQLGLVGVESEKPNQLPAEA
jgi:hypothetical protein